MLALADLAVHPSLLEGLPNAIRGTSEAVVHGETGLLVPPGDAPALARAILHLLESPEEAAALGRAGRRRAAEQFEISARVRELEAVYSRLAAQRLPDRLLSPSRRARSSEGGEGLRHPGQRGQ